MGCLATTPDALEWQVEATPGPGLWQPYPPRGSLKPSVAHAMLESPGESPPPPLTLSGIHTPPVVMHRCPNPIPNLT